MASHLDCSKNRRYDILVALIHPEAPSEFIFFFFLPPNWILVFHIFGIDAPNALECLSEALNRMGDAKAQFSQMRLTRCRRETEEYGYNIAKNEELRLLWDTVIPGNSSASSSAVPVHNTHKHTRSCTILYMYTRGWCPSNELVVIVSQHSSTHTATTTPQQHNPQRTQPRLSCAPLPLSGSHAYLS